MVSQLLQQSFQQLKNTRLRLVIAVYEHDSHVVACREVFLKSVDYNRPVMSS